MEQNWHLPATIRNANAITNHQNSGTGTRTQTQLKTPDIFLNLTHLQYTILLLLYLDTPSIPSLSSDHCPKLSHPQANQTISPNDKILAPHIAGLSLHFSSSALLFSFTAASRPSLGLEFPSRTSIYLTILI